MWLSIKNIWYLCGKELKSVLGDYTLMGLIVIMFSITTYSVSKGVSLDIRNAAVAVINEDRSALSFRLMDSFQAPYFKTIQEIKPEHIDEALNAGKYTFILTIPFNFEKNLIEGKKPKIQVLTDATVISQAGVGIVYIEQIVQKELARYFKRPAFSEQLPIRPVDNLWFNPNGESHWFSAPMQLVSNSFLLAMLLVGAAVIREKERGTIEHLLVMPVSTFEIALAKIISNSLVITIACLLSLYFVVHLWLKIPLTGSVPLFTLTIVIYLFSACSLGIFLSTLTPSMPQFGLLCIPLYVVMRLLSGSETPIEAMPDIIQKTTQFSPHTQFVAASQNILLRSADFSVISDNLLWMGIAGIIFFFIALIRFRRMLSQQG